MDKGPKTKKRGVVSPWSMVHSPLSPKGFSLLEVMVALAILAVALLALVNFQGQSMIIYGRAEKLSLATFLAREKMADILLQLDKEQFQQGSFPEDKSENGVFEKPYEAYKWEYKMRKVEIPAPEGSSAQQDPMIAIVHVVTDQIKEMVREVKLTVSWEELGKEQSFDIVTHISKL
ncbi:MAG: prepilin-type N-terminal cleavage/methylation domain-containing protein [Deltaproteobacteria bacterium]|nr:prepilin-type N-terminal cleavage/methylation domain-containing protein [Deltaproteobacteria bacterium]